MLGRKSSLRLTGGGHSTAAAGVTLGPTLGSTASASSATPAPAGQSSASHNAPPSSASQGPGPGPTLPGGGGGGASLSPLVPSNLATVGAVSSTNLSGGALGALLPASAPSTRLPPEPSVAQPSGPSTLGAAMGASSAGPTATLLDPASVAGFGLGAFELEEVIRARTLWWESATVRWFMRFCAFLSLVSVSTNTSYTFLKWPNLLYVTFVIDVFVAIIFTIEFVSKLKIRGSYAYFHDRWAQFDSIMLACLMASLVLHVFEITHYVPHFSPLSMIRAPRPLIMVRLVRVFLSFSMPRARITQIFLRSSQQIYNVTLFFLFFMSLFGLLGVQFFSKLHHHCVLRDNYTSTYEPSIHHFAIPDTFCSPDVSYGHQCPPTMMCIEIHNATGYSGFDNLAFALFTVYHSSSQEGWYHVMYQAMDSMDVFRSAFYFVTLIFFLAWLVKNVFIAVITETFNEIRVQFQQMWGERAQLATETIPSILVGDDRWRLVQMTDSEAGRAKAWPMAVRRILSTAAFQIFIMVMIVINAMINASIKFDHSVRARGDFYQTIYPVEVFFTIFFNVEVILKIWSYGIRLYVKRSLHKLELILSIGSSLHIIPPLYMHAPFVYFQVLRIVRLIKASPVLEDFVYKIFGPGKKLGSLIIFTMCLLIVTSSISMQFFSCFEGYNKFQSFPEAFMSMFQILTQEGWTEVMNETILRSGRKIGPLVAIYFILYHLFVSLIVLSLFVAVILDNLELDEDIKKVKQLKAREQSAGFNEELPLRLRLFESFPDSPQMTRLHKSANEFAIPKVRDSFMRSFIDLPTTSTTTSTVVSNGKLVATATTARGTTSAGAASTLPTSAVLGPLVGSYHFSGTNSTLASSTTGFGTGLGSSSHRQISLYNGYLAAAAAAGGASGGAGGAGLSANRALLPPSSLLANGSSPGSTSMVNGFGSIRPSTSTLLAMSSHRAKAMTLHHGGHAQPPIKLLNSISKGRHSSPLLRRVQVACIVSDSNNQRLLLGENAPGTGGASTYSRSVTGGAGVGSGNRTAMRRSVRGNIKDDAMTEESLGGVGGGGAGGAGGGAANSGTGGAVRGTDFDFKMLQRKRQQAEMRRTQRESDLRENHPFFDTPLLIVGRESRFRLICQSIVSAKYDPHVRDPITGKERKMRYKGAHELLGLVPYCDWLMIIITTFSCVSMMCETGTQRVANTPWLIIAEYTFIIAMAIELTLKTLADGLLFTPNAYLANVAGVMDFSIFGVSLLFICVLPERVPPGSWQQTLLVLRCIRPLRIFSLVPHMRKVVYELCRGFKEIALVSVLLIVLLFVFSSVGVHMFGGKLARCNDPCITKRENCVGVFMRQVHVTRMKFEHSADNMPAVLVPRVWANPRRFNFDSLGNGILALFEVLSFKGWLDIRDVLLMRLTPVDAIYIHVFVFLGCMIGLTLFVGVVIANYGENKGTALLTVDQRRWCDLKKRLKIAQPLHLPPRPDHHQGRAVIYDITQHIAFKRAIAILVLVNSSLLCVSWDYKNTQNTSEFKMSQNLANVSAGLTVAFVFEVIMKMIAFTPRGYWQSRRNRYDLFVTACGVFWLTLHFSLMNSTSNSIGFIVVILRFFTITGKHATLKMLMLTVAVSVYKSFFIIMGLFLLILCYALAGVNLFGSVKYGENVSRHANFRNAPVGVITLFRIVTGEDWNKIMHDAMLSPPFCTPGPNFWTTDCGNYYASLAFFCSFYVSITYIVLNVLVAIIMENFSLFYSNEEDALLSYADIRNFQNTWNLVDIQQRGMIPVSRVKFVLRLLKGRLEVEPNKDRLLFKHMCHEMERLHNSEDVTFHDVLNMLSYRSVDIRKSLQLEELLAREELEFLIEEEVAKATIRAWLDKCLRRIKKERQQQSLINSLRAQNEPHTATTTGSGATAFFGTSMKGDDEFTFLFDSSPPPASKKDQTQPITPQSTGSNSSPDATGSRESGPSTGPPSASQPQPTPIPPSTLSLDTKPEQATFHLAPVPKDHRDETGQLKKATLAKPQSFSISSSGESTEDSTKEGGGSKGVPGTEPAPAAAAAAPPHKRVEFKASPEAECRRSFKRGDDFDPKPGPSRLGSRKGPVRQLATTLLGPPESGEHPGNGIIPNGGPGGGVSGSKTIMPVILSSGDARRPSESGSETSSASTAKIVKKTTFKDDLPEEIPTHGLAEEVAGQPESDSEPASASKGHPGRRFVSLHSYPPTSAAMEADYNLGSVIRSYKGPRGDPGAGPSGVARESSVESDDEAESVGSPSSSKGPLLSRKPPLPPKPKNHIPYSARLKTLRERKDPKGSAGTQPATPSTLLQTKLVSNISKRIRETKDGAPLLGSAETGAQDSGQEDDLEGHSGGSSSEGEEHEVTAINEPESKALQPQNAGQTKEELAEQEDSIDVDGLGSKKFNLLRAQVMVNEVHEWWLMHLS